MIYYLTTFFKAVDYTGFGGRPSKRKIFITRKLPRRVEKFQADIADESDDLQGEGRGTSYPI